MHTAVSHLPNLPGEYTAAWIYFWQKLQVSGLDNVAIMIAESTPQRYDIQTLTHSLDGHSYTARTAIDIWQEWFVPYFDFIYENADVIQTVAYINARWDDQAMWGPPYTSGYWGDTQVHMNADIQQHWQAELNQEMWLHNQEDLFSILNSMHDKDFDS